MANFCTNKWKPWFCSSSDKASGFPRNVDIILDDSLVWPKLKSILISKAAIWWNVDACVAFILLLTWNPTKINEIMTVQVDQAHIKYSYKLNNGLLFLDWLIGSIPFPPLNLFSPSDQVSIFLKKGKTFS